MVAVIVKTLLRSSSSLRSKAPLAWLRPSRKGKVCRTCPARLKAFCSRNRGQSALHAFKLSQLAWITQETSRKSLSQTSASANSVSSPKPKALWKKLESLSKSVKMQHSRTFRSTLITRSATKIASRAWRGLRTKQPFSAITIISRSMIGYIRSRWKSTTFSETICPVSLKRSGLRWGIPRAVDLILWWAWVATATAKECERACGNLRRIMMWSMWPLTGSHWHSWRICRRRT